MKEGKLLLLLQKKKGFFEAILELTEIEAELTVTEWLSVLQQKKLLLSCIEEVDMELSPYCASLATLSQDLADELEATRSVIHKILHLDAHNQEQRKQELHGHARKK